MDESTGSQAEQSMLSVRKKKSKTALKQQKIDQITHTYQTTTDETLITSSQSEHALTEHEKQIVKTIELDVASLKSEQILFDDEITAIESPDVPKSIEILPVFHAQNIAQEVSTSEIETQINASELPVQSCHVNIKESIPLLITHHEDIEHEGTQKTQEHIKPIKISPIYETKPSTINEEVVAYENVNKIDSKESPHSSIATLKCVPFESKSVSEEMINTKEQDLNLANLNDFKQARETIDLQRPIEVTEIDTIESEYPTEYSYEPTKISVASDVVSNLPITVDEAVVQIMPEKFYPETIVATEEASQSYVQHLSYQAEEICASEKEDKTHLQKLPDIEHANVRFSNKKAIGIEMVDVKDMENTFKPMNVSDLQARATDSLTLSRELEVSLSQGMDTSEQTDNFTYKPASASFSFETLNIKEIETTNVLQSEGHLDEHKAALESKATYDILLHESCITSQIQPPEGEQSFSVDALPTKSKAAPSQEPYLAFVSQDEQLLETSSEHRSQETEQAHTAKINFETKKSTVKQTVLVHDSEKSFETLSQSKLPHYTINTNVNSSISITSPHIVDSEKPFHSQEEPKHQLRPVDMPQTAMHLSTVFETVSYESTENIEKDSVKGNIAKKESMLQHELAVEVCNVSESLDILEQKQFEEKKKATQSISTQKAIEIKTDIAEENLEKLKAMEDKAQLAKIKRDLAFENQINVLEIETSESLSKFDSETISKEAKANISNIEHNEKSIAQVWPVENTQDLQYSPHVTTHVTDMKLIENLPVSVSTDSSTYDLQDLKLDILKPVKAAHSHVSELFGIETKDVIPNEDVGDTIEDLTSKLSKTIESKPYIDIYNTVEQMQMECMENSTLFDKKPDFEKAFGNIRLSDTLTTVNTVEMNTNEFEREFVIESTKQFKGKRVQDNIYVASQTESLPLEHVPSLISELKPKDVYPKSSIEEVISYSTKDEELLEAENILQVDSVEPYKTVHVTTDKFLNVADTMEQTSLVNVKERKADKNAKKEFATTEYEKTLKAPVTVELIPNESSSDIGAKEFELSKAKIILEQQKSIKVEDVEILEKEIQLNDLKATPKKSTQSIEEFMKIAVSEETGINEQLSEKLVLKMDKKTATQISELSHQSEMLESVSMTDKMYQQENAHLVSERLFQSLQIDKPLSLFKEDIIIGDNLNKILTSPKITTQDNKELNRANENETNLKYIQKTEKSTNQIKKIVEKVYEGEIEGKSRTKNSPIIQKIYLSQMLQNKILANFRNILLAIIAFY